MAPHTLDGTVIVQASERLNGSTAGVCVRCGGMMVSSRYIDMLDDTGQLEFVGERCVQCGDVVDPIIRRNRIRQAAVDHHDPQELSRVA